MSQKRRILLDFVQQSKKAFKIKFIGQLLGSSGQTFPQTVYQYEVKADGTVDDTGFSYVDLDAPDYGCRFYEIELPRDFFQGNRGTERKKFYLNTGDPIPLADLIAAGRVLSIADTEFKYIDERLARFGEIVAGADGESAYQIAVENGFVGTEAEWLESLKGEPGAGGGSGEAVFDVASYRGSNFADGDDDAASLNALKNDFYAAKGGTIRLPNGDVYLRSFAEFALDGTRSSYPLKIVGQSGTRVILENETGDCLSFGGFEQVIFESLIFRGRLTKYNDCVTGIAGNRLIFRDCQFYGIRASDSVINAPSVCLSNCFVGGCAGSAFLRTNNYRGWIVENCRFPDYGNLEGVYYSKTPSGLTAWLLAQRDSSTPLNANTPRPLEVRNCFFDEGAISGVRTDNVPFVNISGSGFNTYSGENGQPILVENALEAHFKQCTIGNYADPPLPTPYAVGIDVRMTNRVKIESCFGGDNINKIRVQDIDTTEITGGNLVKEEVPSAYLAMPFKMDTVGDYLQNGWQGELIVNQGELPNSVIGYGEAFACNGRGANDMDIPLGVFSSAQRSLYHSDEVSRVYWRFEGLNNNRTYKVRLLFNCDAAGDRGGRFTVNDSDVLSNFSIAGNAPGVGIGYSRLFETQPVNNEVIVSMQPTAGFSSVNLAGIILDYK